MYLITPFIRLRCRIRINAINNLLNSHPNRQISKYLNYTSRKLFSTNNQFDTIFISNIIFEIGIPNLEQLKMSTVKDLILLGGKVRKVYNLRGVRLTIGFVNAAIKLQSVVTPIYWVKKGTNIVSVNSLSQFLVKCMFEVVGKVTANIYSKNFTNN